MTIQNLLCVLGVRTSIHALTIALQGVLLLSSCGLGQSSVSHEVQGFGTSTIESDSLGSESTPTRHDSYQGRLGNSDERGQITGGPADLGGSVQFANYMGSSLSASFSIDLTEVQSTLRAIERPILELDGHELEGKEWEVPGTLTLTSWAFGELEVPGPTEEESFTIAPSLSYDSRFKISVVSADRQISRPTTKRTCNNTEIPAIDNPFFVLSIMAEIDTEAGKITIQGEYRFVVMTIEQYTLC